MVETDYKKLWITSRQVIDIQDKMVKASSLLCEQLGEINDNYLAQIRDMQRDIIVLGDMHKQQLEEIAGYKKILSDNGFKCD